MKSLRAGVFALAMLVAGAPATAAESFLVGLHAGVSSPAHDFGDAIKAGFQGTLSGTWMLGAGWGVGADVGYQRWGGNDALNGFFQEGDELSGAFPPSQAEVRLSAIQLRAHGLYRYPTAGGTMPWLKAGLGLYVLSSDLANAQMVALDASKSYFGFNVGVGVDFPVSTRYALGVEAGYQRIELGDLDIANFDEDNWYVLFFEKAEPFTVGVNVTWGGPPTDTPRYAPLSACSRPHERAAR